MAVTHLPEPHPTDPVVEQLALFYRNAYDATLAELQRAVVGGLSTTFREALLLRLGRRLAELRLVTQAWAYGPVDPATGARLIRESALYKAVAAADRETLSQLAALGIAVEVPPAGAISASFALLNDAAIRVAAVNLVQSMDRAITQFDTSVRGIIGRATNDVFRRETLQAVGEKLTQGLTVRQSRARLAADLAEQGITAFVDSKGRRWTLKSYSDMAIRTATRETTSEATLRRIEGEGLDYVKASEHRPTCELCAVRQGRIYCISGRDPRFPALRTVGNTPWHPNCGHVTTGVVLKYVKDLEAEIAASNAPFDVDPRSQAEIDLYERSQAINRERNLKRKLSAQLEAPGLDPDTEARLRARRAAANRRLIEHNRAQRRALPGWR
jgi:hypothetical protein